MVKVKGQGHQVKKCDFQAMLTFFLICKTCYKTLDYCVISGCHMMPQLDATLSCDITKQCHLGKRTFKMPDAGGA